LAKQSLGFITQAAPQRPGRFPALIEHRWSACHQRARRRPPALRAASPGAPAARKGIFRGRHRRRTVPSSPAKSPSLGPHRSQAGRLPFIAAGHRDRTLRRAGGGRASWPPSSASQPEVHRHLRTPHGRRSKPSCPADDGRLLRHPGRDHGCRVEGRAKAGPLCVVGDVAVMRRAVRLLGVSLAGRAPGSLDDLTGVPPNCTGLAARQSAVDLIDCPVGRISAAAGTAASRLHHGCGARCSNQSGVRCL
jgi:hypothetical protein